MEEATQKICVDGDNIKIDFRKVEWGGVDWFRIGTGSCLL
jgi:hypothetical protein